MWQAVCNAVGIGPHVAESISLALWSFWHTGEKYVLCNCNSSVIQCTKGIKMKVYDGNQEMECAVRENFCKEWPLLLRSEGMNTCVVIKEENDYWHKDWHILFARKEFGKLDKSRMSLRLNCSAWNKVRGGWKITWIVHAGHHKPQENIWNLFQGQQKVLKSFSSMDTELYFMS